MTSSLIPGCNDGLLRQPASRLLRFDKWKKLHRRATDSRSGKTKRKRLPTGLSDDGDLGNLTAMQKRKSRSFPQSAPRSQPSKFSRMTSKRGFDPMSILRARAFCSAPIRIVSKCR